MTPDPKAARERLNSVEFADQGEGYCRAVMAVYGTQPLNQFYTDIDAITAERDALAARVAVLEGQALNDKAWELIAPTIAHPTPEALARAERAEAFIRSLPGVCDSFCDCDGDQVAGQITARVEEFLDDLSPSPATQPGDGQ
jgi:hypothetical protein